MTTRTLPDLGRLSNQLVAHNARIGRYLETLPKHVDKLVQAMEAGDLSEVKRLSDFLASSSVMFDCPEMTEIAQSVCDAVDKPNNETEIKRSVMRLISVCGSVRRPRDEKPSDNQRTH
jgi:HPt (histidine-containing phosphotransfer) domain-containing protein